MAEDTPAFEPLPTVVPAAAPAPDASHGEDQVQEKVDAETEAGLRGHKVDPTPNAHYTVAGVIAGKPTPENNAGREEADNG